VVCKKIGYKIPLIEEWILSLMDGDIHGKAKKVPEFLARPNSTD
jgi:hypothetical protein